MKKCPRCGQLTLEDEDGLNALSRRDNKTYICHICGEEEHFIDQGLIFPGKRERDFVAKVAKKTGGRVA